MAIDRTELLQFFDSAVEEHENEGRRMLAGDYYTNPYYTGGPRNVGQDVLDAVASLRTACSKLREGAQLSAENLLLQISECKTEFDLNAIDEDGYGLAVFGSVIRKLLEFAHERGEALELEFDSLNSSAPYLRLAESYARGDMSHLEELVKTYLSLPPEESAWIDSLLFKQLEHEKKGHPLIALRTVDLLRLFYKAIGIDVMETKLLVEKHKLIGKAAQHSDLLDRPDNG